MSLKFWSSETTSHCCTSVSCRNYQAATTCGRRQLSREPFNGTKLSMSGANFAMILSHVLVMMNNGLVEPHDGLTTDEIATESYSSVQEKDRFVFYVKTFRVSTINSSCVLQSFFFHIQLIPLDLMWHDEWGFPLRDDLQLRSVAIIN